MNKKIEPKKESLGELMLRYNAVFSLNTDSGYANVDFEKDFNGRVDMIVKFFDEDGRSLTNEYCDGGVPVDEITKVANFIKDIKEMKLPEYIKES